ncbi:hypothetical protein GK091_25485 [Spirosoma agri]|uniref:Uncharacterized protein n=1 Tax=Spirosoma agri TaxID=1987381 RepID=A0A6M0IRX2_9BACT|nr:hypothetical protein [Spirosoma agri]NEU70255.1 hypothetical protein [Spirosoma agri]
MGIKAIRDPNKVAALRGIIVHHTAYIFNLFNQSTSISTAGGNYLFFFTRAYDQQQAYKWEKYRSHIVQLCEHDPQFVRRVGIGSLLIAPFTMLIYEICFISGKSIFERMVFPFSQKCGVVYSQQMLTR